MAVIGLALFIGAGNASAERKAPTQNKAAAGSNVRFLHVGETSRYDKGGLKITFLSVASDTRCPTNARCISAGDAEVVLKIKAGNQKAKTVTLHTNGKPRRFVIPANDSSMIGIPKSYVITLADLTPDRTIGKKIRPRDYEAKLKIQTAF